MLSRRDMLIGTTALGAANLLRRVTTVCAKAAQPATRVGFEVPENACDCHVHIFGDSQRFPFAASRTYTPEGASVRELQELHGALHIKRVVIIQPSVYGTDNSCTLDALKQLGPRARGIAVIDDQTSRKVLDEMDRAGVRGIRINLGTAGQNDPVVARQRLQAALEQIKGREWHIQMYMKLSVITDIREQIAAAPVPIVFDHFGGAQAAFGIEQPGFNTLLELVRSGKVYVKISGAYRASTQAPGYPDVAPLARALISANPSRVLWGTDWPHPQTVASSKPTDISSLLPIDDGHLLNLLALWVPDAALRKTILVDNPVTLYRF